MEKKEKIILIIITIIIFLIISFTLYYNLYDEVSPIIKLKDEIIAFPNEKLNPKDVVDVIEDNKTTFKDLKIKIEKDKSYENLGIYNDSITVIDSHGNKTIQTFSYRVIIKDVNPPKIEGVTNIRSLVGEKINYLDGITVSDDLYPVEKLKLIVDTKNIDINKPGKYKISYKVSDSRNTTNKKAIVEIVEDKKGPKIIGVRDINLNKGMQYDFKTNILLDDEFDDNPKLVVDTKNLNINEAGNYKVIYKASDKFGNTTTKKINVKVVEKQIINLNNDSNKIIYLTFDDGPSIYTEELLQILDEYNVKATFFVIGKNSYLYKSIVDSGHAIGLHTDTHQYSIYSSEQTYFNDLNVLEEKIRSEIGFSPKIIRFPGGTSNTISKKYNEGIMSRLSMEVINRGYKFFDWNCITGDGNGGKQTIEKQMEHVKRCHDDVIYLLAHDTLKTTVLAMRQIIPYFLEQGYQFKTITLDTNMYHQKINN